MRGTVLVVALSVGLSATCLPRRAAACSIAQPPPSLVGTPADGDAFVPTDVVPTYSAFESGVNLAAANAAFELVSESGDVVAASLRQSQLSHFEIVPAGVLEPRTRYRLQGTAAGTALALSFSTGDGPVAEPPLPPDAHVQNFVMQVTQSDSCHSVYDGLCMRLPAGFAVESTVVDRSGAAQGGSYLYFGSYPAQFDETYDCLRLRSRAANAAYSDPLTFCKGDGPTVILRSAYFECTEQGVVVDGVPVDGADDSSGETIVTEGCGCSVPGGRASHSSSLIAGLAALACGFRLRRRAR
jgi:hypothetical protein